MLNNKISNEDYNHKVDNEEYKRLSKKDKYIYKSKFAIGSAIGWKDIYPLFSNSLIDKINNSLVIDDFYYSINHRIKREIRIKY